MQLQLTKNIPVCLMLFMLLLLPEVALADRYKSIDSTTPQEVADGMGNKLVRGVANALTGWGEFPKQIYYTTREDGWTKGVTVGPFKGLFMTVTRTVAGAVEIFTFLIPYPGFYDPLFDPAYVWQQE